MTESDYSRIEHSYKLVMRDMPAPTVAAAVLTLVRVIEREQLTAKPAETVHARLMECVSKVHSTKYREGLVLAAMLECRK